MESRDLEHLTRERRALGHKLGTYPYGRLAYHPHNWCSRRDRLLHPSPFDIPRSISMLQTDWRIGKEQKIRSKAARDRAGRPSKQCKVQHEETEIKCWGETIPWHSEPVFRCWSLGREPRHGHPALLSFCHMVPKMKLCPRVRVHREEPMSRGEWNATKNEQRLGCEWKCGFFGWW